MHTLKLFRVFNWMVLLLIAVAYSPAKADFTADWKALIEAARKEGKVVLNSVPGAKMRKELPLRKSSAWTWNS